MKKKNRIVLAEGEVTGHEHAVLDRPDIEFDGTYIIAPSPFTVTHEEHKPIEVPAGGYERSFVVEENPFTKQAEQVLD